MNFPKHPVRFWGLAAASLGALAGIFCIVPGTSCAVTLRAHQRVLISQEQSEQTRPVKPEDVEKYIKVYRAMQHNRRLTVQQAAARENLTVAQFRDIEGRIERSGTLRERVRRALLESAKAHGPGSAYAPSATPSH